MEAVERRDPLAAALDERRAAGEEERHVGAEMGGDRVTGVLVELGAPRLERAVERRRGVGGAAGEPRRDRDPLVEPGRERRCRPGSARPAATDRRPGRRERAEDEVVAPAARRRAR